MSTLNNSNENTDYEETTFDDGSDLYAYSLNVPTEPQVETNTAKCANEDQYEYNYYPDQTWDVSFSFGKITGESKCLGPIRNNKINISKPGNECYCRVSTYPKNCINHESHREWQKADLSEGDTCSKGCAAACAVFTATDLHFRMTLLE